jgi:hypothetical protein
MIALGHIVYKKGILIKRKGLLFNPFFCNLFLMAPYNVVLLGLNHHVMKESNRKTVPQHSPYENPTRLGGSTLTRGRHVTDGYWNRSKSTAKVTQTLVQGGHTAASGFYTIVYREGKIW